MEHALSLGRSAVNVNTRGGYFNWSLGGRPVMPLINVPNSTKQRSTHTIFPFFGLPKEPVPGATRLMERHGPFRTSELTVLGKKETSIGLELANRPSKPDQNLFAQFPYYFVAQQRLELLNENTLRFVAEHTNVGENTSQSTLALHSYFNYDDSGVTLTDLAGRPYQITKDGEILDNAVLTNPLISGPLVFRDWKFPAAGLKEPFRISFPDGRTISIKVSASHPAVNNWMVWMDETQCKLPNAFICVEPMIEGIVLGQGDTAVLDVLISVE